MTQNEMVLRLLRLRGERGLTAIEALHEVGTLRLAARVNELRTQHHITSHMVSTPNGAKVARYVLHEQPVQLTLDDAA